MISTGEIKVSIIIPCFNEKDTISIVIEKIHKKRPTHSSQRLPHPIKDFLCPC